MLELVIDTNLDIEPDLDVLDTDFYRGQVQQLSNTSIINGQIRRSRTWSVALMAKRTGTLEIPSIQVGSESSEPVEIVVNEAKAAPPGEADVFVTSEVDQTEAYVQAQILYRIKNLPRCAGSAARFARTAVYRRRGTHRGGER